MLSRPFGLPSLRSTHSVCCWRSCFVETHLRHEQRRSCLCQTHLRLDTTRARRAKSHSPAAHSRPGKGLTSCSRTPCGTVAHRSHVAMPVGHAPCSAATVRVCVILHITNLHKHRLPPFPLGCVKRSVLAATPLCASTVVLVWWKGSQPRPVDLLRRNATH